jgi:hypothetical protein
MPEPKKVAAIVTEYRLWSHADVIIGKILDGFSHDGGAGPNLRVASMYVDQFAEKDMSRAQAKKHKFTIHDSIEGALTLGGRTLAVDGVICVGEHGKYPTNDKGQVLYPRRRFFEEVCKVFAKTKKSVPVFNDKHLAATWKDAKWMYDRSRELFVPFLAGSSLPLTWRKPPLQLPKDCLITEAVQIGYGGLEAYGFHALEGLQCMVERRKGGETGVKAVQCVMGKEMWKKLDDGAWSKSVLEAAMAAMPQHTKGDYRELVAKQAESGVFLIEYRDGLKAAVAIMNGWVSEAEGGGFTFAAQLKDEKKPRASLFYLQQADPFGHFNYLVKAIDSMMQTGHPGYPVERTLLTTGILDAVMTSKADKGKRIDTPHLAIKYKPTDWPFAKDAVPKEIKR